MQMSRADDSESEESFLNAMLDKEQIWKLFWLNFNTDNFFDVILISESVIKLKVFSLF